MEFYAHDTVQWTPAPGKKLDLIVIPPGDTAGNVSIKLTVDDKNLPLEVGDKVMHGAIDGVVKAVEGNGAYTVTEPGGPDTGDGPGTLDAQHVARAELTLVEGKRTVPKNQVTPGDVFFKKLMDTTARVSGPC